jgi:D-lactate dehydrogenase (cytochrome)
MKTEKFDNLITPLADRHTDYLRDESRTAGKAESISFPQSEAQIQAIVTTLARQKIPITVQGSRTGITGGAVPVRGHIMNLSKMNRVTGMEQDPDGRFSIRVQPGIILSELDRFMDNRRFDSYAWDKAAWNKKSLTALKAFKKANRLFWPPDPSEGSASVGGIAAGNSRGICALHYGPARDHINGIRVIDGNGRVHSITRGSYLFSNGRCPLPDGGTIQLDSTDPDPGSTTDLLDFYLGSQGMFGVITELTLSLASLPSELWGMVFFFENQLQSLDFIESVTHGQGRKHPAKSDTHIVAVEFMDHTTLASIRKFKQMNTQGRKIPDWDKRFVAVYLEIHSNSSAEIETLCELLLEKATRSGSDPTTWAACGRAEVEQLRLFRHAAPEAVNQLIDQARLKDSRITKLGTDMGLKNESLHELMELYTKDLKASGLNAAIFGHAADGHLHVNILPENYLQFAQGKKLIENWAIRLHAKGGSVVTEHGVGKIKKKIFRSIPLPRDLLIMCKIKQQLDPEGVWNPGNMPDSP